MPDDARDGESVDELGRRLRAIESRPLAERAAAYTALHDELARRLEADPPQPST